MPLGKGHRAIGDSLGLAALGIGQHEAQRLADGRMERRIQRGAVDDFGARVGLFELLADGRVVGLPDDGGLGDGGQLYRALGETQFDLALASRDHFVDPAALLILLGVAFVEDDAVARLKC